MKAQLRCSDLLALTQEDKLVKQSVELLQLSGPGLQLPGLQLLGSGPGPGSQVRQGQARCSSSQAISSAQQFAQAQLVQAQNFLDLFPLIC